MEIAIDFDGTCVTHEYPLIGKEIGAVSVLKKLIEAGHNLILFTMRSGSELDDAVNWFSINDIPLYGVQENPTQKQWTTSNKCYAQLYIDDAGINCPLIHPGKSITGVIIHKGKTYVDTARPYVDWDKVEYLLIQNKIL